MEGFDKIRDLNLAELGEDTEESTETVAEEVVLEADEVTEVAEVEVEEETPAGPVKKEKMDEPVGQHYYVEADITETILRNFLFGHAYRQPISILITVLAICGPIIYLVKGQTQAPFAFLVSAVVLIYYPFSIWTRAKKIKRTNKTFAEIFHYMFDERGCHLQLAEEAIDVDWKYFKKMMVLKSLVVLYTSRYNGYIVPIASMGSQKEEIIAFLKEKVNQK